MKILVVGSGGREHALCWAIAASPLCDELLCAPGNAGIADLAECVAVAVDDHHGLVSLCAERAADFGVVGPEAPLVSGLVDDLTAAGQRVLGPTKSAARLEGSKLYAREFMAAAGIPHPRYHACHTIDEARAAA